MTVAPYAEPNGVAPTNPADQSSRGVARVAQWAEAAEAAHRLAEALCQTSFCPEPYRNKPGEATAAILAGAEVGLSPLAALNAFDPIQGRAAARAITLRAVVQSYGHDIELVESNERRCTMRGRRKGAETWQTITWTIERAAKLKLTSKQQWQTQPTAMLMARATSEISRLVASDAILGIAYSAEEIEDALGPNTPEGRRKVQRQTAKAAIAAPAASPEDDDELLGEGTVMATTEEPPKTAEPEQPDLTEEDWPPVKQPPETT